MAINLEKIRAKLDKLNGKDNHSDLFWRADAGTHTIRIIPSEDGEPLKEKHFHYNISKGGVLCPKRNYGEDCPICEFATSLFREGTPDSQEQAKKLFVNQRFYADVIVRGKEEDGPKIWSFPKSAYKALLETILDEDYGDVTDARKGFDLKVTYIKKNFGRGDRMVFDSLQPRPRPTPLSEDDAQAAAWMDNDIDLNKIFERKSVDDAQKVLDEYLMPEKAFGDNVKYGGNTQEKKVSSVDAAFRELGVA